MCSLCEHVCISKNIKITEKFTKVLYSENMTQHENKISNVGGRAPWWEGAHAEADRCNGKVDNDSKEERNGSESDTDI